MLLYIDIITVIISLPILYKTVRRIITLRCSMLDFCLIAFWVMQILPLVILKMFDVSEELPWYFLITHKAMSDSITGMVYDALTAVTLYILFVLSNRSTDSIQMSNLTVNNLNISFNPIISYLLFLGMMLPVLIIFLSPKPTIYFQIGYFYQNEFEKSTELYVFHNQFRGYCKVSLVCVLLMYLSRKKTSLICNLDILISIISITMLNQKRTLLVYALFGILVIDLFKGNYKMNMSRLALKAFLFLGIFMIYFIVYSEVSGKGSDTSFGNDYILYFSRISALKTAIYDALNGENILAYHGESLLYNLLFFVPRALWKDKPAMYVKYFTPYSVGFDSHDFLDWNLHVNIWTEFVSNFNLIGQFIAILFSYLISKVCEKSKNVICVLIGTLFLILYYMYGFENMVQVVWVVLLFSLTWNKISNVQFKEIEKSEIKT